MLIGREYRLIEGKGGLHRSLPSLFINMAVPVSFFQRERASVELAGGLVGVCGTGAAGGDWQDDTGDTPETQAIIIKWLQKSIIQDSFPSSFCSCQFASFSICFQVSHLLIGLLVNTLVFYCV